jgi:hypothetical protein
MGSPDNKQPKGNGLRAIIGFLVLVICWLYFTRPEPPHSPPASGRPSAYAQTVTEVAAPQPYVCDLLQVWKEGDVLSEVRKTALDDVVRWTGDTNVMAKNRCSVNSRTDAQLEIDARAEAEKASREKADAAKQSAIEENRQREEKVAGAKRQREQEIEQSRSAEQDARDHAKDVRAGIKDGSINLLSAADLSAQTHKWDGQKIVTTLSCFYADADDFRCVGGRMRIDFASFEPDDAEATFKKNCDTITKSQRRACSLKILFTYEGFDEMDVGGGLFGGRITVVQAASKSGEILPK